MKKPIVITAICLAVCAIIAFFVFLVMNMGNILFLVMMGNIGTKTVVQTLPSPDGTYEARVIDVDEGALGGSTIVEVERNGWLARPKRIYLGEWGEYETMEIYWKNDDCLVINGKEYSVYG